MGLKKGIMSDDEIGLIRAQQFYPHDDVLLAAQVAVNCATTSTDDDSPAHLILKALYSDIYLQKSIDENAGEHLPDLAAAIALEAANSAAMITLLQNDLECKDLELESNRRYVYAESTFKVENTKAVANYLLDTQLYGKPSLVAQLLRGRQSIMEKYSQGYDRILDQSFRQWLNPSYLKSLYERAEAKFESAQYESAAFDLRALETAKSLTLHELEFLIRTLAFCGEMALARKAALTLPQDTPNEVREHVARLLEVVSSPPQRHLLALQTGLNFLSGGKKEYAARALRLATRLQPGDGFAKVSVLTHR